MNAYPNRETSLRLLGGHRFSIAWEKMQDHYLDGILSQASKNIEKWYNHLAQIERQRQM